MHAAALGLGNVTLESRLNEPLQVRIALVGTQLEAVNLNATVASEAQHSAAGIENVELLRQLRVEVFTPPWGGAYVRVSTERSIREPVVSFLIVVENAREHVMREYTVLLDPPGYSPPKPQPQPRRRLERRPERPPQAEVASPPARVTAPRREIHPLHVGPVARGTTLSKLAMGIHRERGVTWAQMTWALFTANPHAFIDEDINRLRAGVYLKVPSAGDASRWSHRQALALINGAPAEREVAAADSGAAVKTERVPPAAASVKTEERTGSPVASQQESVESAPEPVPETQPQSPQPLFRLAAPDEVYEPRASGSVGVPMSADDRARIDQMIALANRQIQDSQEEIAGARAQLAETAKQISTLVETVAQKDSEIQGLESRIADLRQITKEQSVAMARTEPNWMQRLLLEAVLLGGMVVVLAVTLSRWTDARRRREGGNGTQTLVLESPSLVKAPVETPAKATDEETVPEVADEDPDAEPLTHEGLSIDHLELTEAGVEDDPLMEANAYFAYGYHEKAKDVLTDIIKENPAQSESRLIMLRVLHAMREKRKFRRHAEALLELVDNRFDERWLEAARLGRALFPDERLFNAETHKRSEDENWEETIWTGTRPKLPDRDEHVYLDIDEFKYVDLFLVDEADEADEASEASEASEADETDEADEAESGDSLDASSPPPPESEDLEAELSEWRAEVIGGGELAKGTRERADSVDGFPEDEKG
jgi:pilus assembly protein FimV